MVIEPADVQELLDKEPFEQFRIHMSEGKSHDVVNPDLAVAMESNFFLALPKGSWKLLSYIKMASIEDIQRRARVRRNGRRKT